MRGFKGYKQVVKRAEELFGEHFGDWSFVLNEYGNWYFEAKSPAGENLLIASSYKGEPQGFINHIADELNIIADDYDADEHIEYWTSSRDANGEFYKATKELIEDAEAIGKMYDELAMKFRRAAQLFYSDAE